MMQSAISYQDGAPIPGLYPALQQVVLSSVAAASGVASPGVLSASIVPLVPANSTVPLLAPNPMRTFLLVYNPTQMVMQFSKGQATQGNINNLSIGPGQAYFWADAQGLGQVYQGPLTAVGLFAPLPLWVWEDGTEFYNDGGVLAFSAVPAAWPTSPVGLPLGAVWNNGLTVGVVPTGGVNPFTNTFTNTFGGTPGEFNPNPSAAPVFFGSITAAGLLALGGGNLPISNPGQKNQLWNDNGVVSIA